MHHMVKPVLFLGVCCVAMIPILSQLNDVNLYGFLALNLVTSLFVGGRFIKASGRSERIFWQFLLLAMSVNFIQNVIVDFSLTDNILLTSSIQLITYLMLTIAIESSPHLNHLAMKRLATPIVSILIFSVLLFCYFVLIPLELGTSDSVAQSSNLLFHFIIFCVLGGRLLSTLLNGVGDYFKIVYSMLVCAIIAILLQYYIAFKEAALSDFFQSFLTQVPYLMVIGITLINPSRYVAKKIKADSHSDVSANFVILMTIIVLSFSHLYGVMNSKAFIVDLQFQTIIVGIWLVLGSCFLVFNIYSLVQRNRHLKHALTQHQTLLSDAESYSDYLNHQIVNSEDTAIVNASNNAILTVDTAGKCLSANPTAVQMFQYLSTTLVGSHIKKLFDDNDEMHYFFDFKSNVYSLERNRSGISRESVACRADKVQFPVQVELQWAERRDDPLIVITFINLTDRKRREEKSLELKDKFIANISHEFRTPLTIINGILDRYLVDEKSNNELVIAKRNGLRLVTMVEQLLELSRLRDNPTMTFHHYRLASLMAMPIESFSRLAQQNTLTFSSTVPPDLWVECDAQGFEKILFNLLSNAIKYTPSGGDVTVVTYVENDSIVLDVIDNGIGISTEYQHKIFERFQRAENQQTNNTFGVGIGLSLVNELVAAHGWHISLISELDKGSKFSLSMPMAQPQIEDSPLIHSTLSEDISPLFDRPKNVNVSQKPHSQKVVLIIEDNLDMQNHIKQVVESNHHCLLAGSGEVGLELAKEYLPDLIVCDLMLTGIDGFTVLNTLKTDEITSHIPVILLTARSDQESKLKGLNLSADDYLGKPFQHEELLTRIQNLIDNRVLLQQSFQRKADSKQQESRLESVQESLEKLVADTNVEQSPEAIFVQKLEEVVAKYYTEPLLDVNFIAKEMAMSERQLQRKIKVILGTTTNNFIKELRLKKAKVLLQNGLQIGRVAMDVGFSSQTYFGRCFKEQYHCTPKQFQQGLKD